MIKRNYPFIRQMDAKDCGITCLAMIIKYYQGNVSQEVLRDLTYTDKNGTDAYHLIEGAKAIGMEAQGFKTDIKYIEKQHLPCVAHVIIDKNIGHYVVIYEINFKQQYVLIADPASKLKKMKISEFLKIYNNIIIVFKQSHPNFKYPNQLNSKKYLVSLFNKYKYYFIKLVIFSFILILLSLLCSINLAVFLQVINLKEEWLVSVFILFIFLYIIKNILTYIREKLVSVIHYKLDQDIKCSFFQNIIFLPYRFYHNRTTGGIASRLQDLDMVSGTFSRLFIFITIDFILMLLSGFFLFYINKLLFAITFIIGLIYTIITYISYKVMYPRIQRIKEENAYMSNYMIESIRGFETIKNMNIESSVANIFKENYTKYNDKKRELEKKVFFMNGVRTLIEELGYVVIYYVSCLYMINNNMSLETIIVYQSLLTYFFLPLHSLSEMNFSICDMKLSLRRMLELSELKDSDNKEECVDIEKIQLKNACYETKRLILNKVNLSINKKEKIMLVGNSGSGKSTLLKLIRGYLNVTTGAVMINGKDILKYSKNSLAQRITYVSQDEILFTDTFYNNITVGKPLTKAQLSSYLQITEANQIIQNQIFKENSLVEENGCNLSGGEKQRIILTRSLLKESNILLIDEGFSQMDKSLERKILKNLFKLYPDKIIIVVSHRIDNLDLFDTYIQIEHGQVKKRVSKNLARKENYVI